jgi:hypothetical protein
MKKRLMDVPADVQVEWSRYSVEIAGRRRLFVRVRHRDQDNDVRVFAARRYAFPNYQCAMNDDNTNDLRVLCDAPGRVCAAAKRATATPRFEVERGGGRSSSA